MPQASPNQRFSRAHPSTSLPPRRRHHRGRPRPGSGKTARPAPARAARALRRHSARPPCGINQGDRAAGSNRSSGARAETRPRFLLLLDRLDEDVGDTTQRAGRDRVRDQQRRGLVRRIDPAPGCRGGATLVRGKVSAAAVRSFAVALCPFLEATLDTVVPTRGARPSCLRLRLTADMPGSPRSVHACLTGSYSSARRTDFRGAALLSASGLCCVK